MSGAGRVLVCTTCREPVRVFEILAATGELHEFIDPALYVCGQCLRPAQAELSLDGPREETRPYDPAIAAIPY